MSQEPLKSLTAGLAGLALKSPARRAGRRGAALAS
jgi:hypothetical protein